jgi:hypothetical protein
MGICSDNGQTAVLDNGQQAWSRGAVLSSSFLLFSRRPAREHAKRGVERRGLLSTVQVEGQLMPNSLSTVCERRPWTQTLRATRGEDRLMVIVALDGAESDGSYSRHDVRSSCIKTNELHTNGTVPMQGLITPEGQLGRG